MIFKDRKRYSTDEIKTGETWIDGKTIYRKVVVHTINDVTGIVDINLGITDVETYTNKRVLIDTSTYTAIDNTQSNTDYYMRNWVFRKSPSNNTVSVVINMSSGVTGTIYIIIEYTKKTD